MYLHVDWKFINLNQAFSEAVGTSSCSLMVYSNVMRHNVVGDMQHSLVREDTVRALTISNPCKYSTFINSFDKINFCLTYYELLQWGQVGV